MAYAFIVAAVLIALAELGDKTQLLALALAAKYRVWQVIVGITVATLAVHLISTVAGRLIGGVIPDLWLGIITGVLFIGFGIWTIRGDSDDQEEGDASGSGRFGPVLTVAAVFFLAEFGDKTQFMSMTIAADPAAVLRTFGAAGPAIAEWLAALGLTARGLTPAGSFWGVWLGSTVGMLLADAVAIVVGAVLGHRLPERIIARVSGSIFILFGVLALVSVLVR
jgi:putative Ca2+/H+ antiporter (TMEM165/GDT1 family)